MRKKNRVCYISRFRSIKKNFFSPSNNFEGAFNINNINDSFSNSNLYERVFISFLS